MLSFVNTPHRIFFRALFIVLVSIIALPAHYSIAVVDATPPITTVISPNQGAVVYGSVLVRASATDVNGIQKVDFYFQPDQTGSTVHFIGSTNIADSTGNYSVNWNTNALAQGDYKIIAKAIDNTGNTGTSAAISLTVSSVLPQNTPPHITLLGDNPIIIVKGKPFVDPGATALDVEDGILSVQKSGKKVDTAVIGTYTITYTATDKGGLSASVIRTINVIRAQDVLNTPPSISLLGESKITVVQGDIFTDPGAQATDAEDGDLRLFIKKTGVVDTKNLGTYTLQYTVSDRSSLPLSATVYRTVVVIEKCVADNSCDKKLGTITETAISKIKETISSPYADPISKSIAVTGLVFGAAGSIATIAFSTPFSLSEIFLLPLRIWTLLLVALGLKKRARPWGTVYDAVTKRPLDPVFLELVDKTGKVAATAITDIDGRYGFMAPPGYYMIRAKKTDYSFPSLLLGHVTRDEIYLDLYFGNYFELKRQGEVITKNIPMDPNNFSWNEFAKQEQSLTHFYSRRTFIMTRVTDILFSIGFITALIAFLSAPRPYNIFIFAIYIVMLVVKEVGPSLSKLGSIVDKTTGRPLANAIIRVYSAALGNEVLRKIATERGQFYCLIPNGGYVVTIEKKNPKDGSYTKVFTSDTVQVTSGIIKGVWRV